MERSALCRHGGEADNVTEVDGDRVEGLRLHALARGEAVRHRPATTAPCTQPTRTAARRRITQLHLPLRQSHAATCKLRYKTTYIRH